MEGPNIKVIHLSFSDARGGAARAAYRIHQALLHHGVNSEMWLNESLLGDRTTKVWGGKAQKFSSLLRRIPAAILLKLLRTSQPVLHSPALLRSRWVSRINQSDADIVHLHWVQAEMLSIEDFARIKKPVVWTLHDMWGFCGAEHISENERWTQGYSRHNRPDCESGFDLNRWVWSRKRRSWTRPFTIVTPSQWLKVCAKDSSLMINWPVEVIPNPLDTRRWRPLEKELAREFLNLPKNALLLLFGAIGGTADELKGFKLLTEALGYLEEKSGSNSIELVVFGQLEPDHPPIVDFPVHYLGHLHDDVSLIALYSAVDVMMVPSRIEAFGQTASEANSCGTPVVAFDTSGLRDIVQHKKNGYLARCFDTRDFAEGISWALGKSASDGGGFRRIVHRSASRRFSYETVGLMYKQLLEETLRSSLSRK